MIIKLAKYINYKYLPLLNNVDFCVDMHVYINVSFLLGSL